MVMHYHHNNFPRISLGSRNACEILVCFEIFKCSTCSQLINLQITLFSDEAAKWIRKCQITYAAFPWGKNLKTKLTAMSWYMFIIKAYSLNFIYIAHIGQLFECMQFPRFNFVVGFYIICNERNLQDRFLKFFKRKRWKKVIFIFTIYRLLETFIEHSLKYPKF